MCLSLFFVMCTYHPCPFKYTVNCLSSNVPNYHSFSCMQVMFEEYKFAGVYIAIQAVLTLYAQGNVQLYL